MTFVHALSEPTITQSDHSLALWATAARLRTRQQARDLSTGGELWRTQVSILALFQRLSVPKSRNLGQLLAGKQDRETSQVVPVGTQVVVYSQVKGSTRWRSEGRRRTDQERSARRIHPAH